MSRINDLSGSVANELSGFMVHLGRKQKGECANNREASSISKNRYVYPPSFCLNAWYLLAIIHQHAPLTKERCSIEAALGKMHFDPCTLHPQCSLQEPKCNHDCLQLTIMLIFDHQGNKTTISLLNMKEITMPLPLIILPLAVAAKAASPWVGYYVIGGALGGGGVVGGAWFFSSSSNKAEDTPRTHSQPSQNSTNSKDVIGAMMRLGNYHQVDQKKDPSLAFECYLKAAQLGAEDALIPLNRLGEEMSAEKQLLLSELYKSVFKNKEKANYWQEKATELAKLDGLSF